MKIDVDPFRIHEGKKADLDKRATKVKPFYGSKADYTAALGEHVKRLSKLQEHLHRSGRYALLIVLQGMDTAGKDGAITHVMSGVNPRAARSSHSRLRPRQKRRTTSSGASAAHCPSAARSASSIAPITSRCW